jgi:uncharacterized repeat protein (TIGR03943 family)
MHDLLARPRFSTAIKALLLLALAGFFYTRLAGGTLFFYINERFMIYTVLAIIGLVLVAVSYRPVRSGAPAPGGPEEQREEHREDDGHAHVGGEDAGHDHRLTWGGVALVALPILLGVLVPPQPLGAAALANREVNVTLQGSALPAAVRAAAEKAATDKNVLDWGHTFAAAADPAQQFAGENAKVTGFVFRDERFAADQFMVTRFVVSCCVADANVAGMVVTWPQAAELSPDQWVEVAGTLAPGTLGGEALPVLQAASVTDVAVPQQPYLYP